MSLQHVLGVLGDVLRSDASEEELAAAISSAQDLSAAEREDLARIPFSRLAPYQHDLYMAERNMLIWGFEHTWACLHRLQFGMGADVVGDPERAFVVRFKRDYPSATHSVRELGALFLKYLAREHAELCSAHPWLLELAEAERLEIEVLYAMDSTLGRPLDADARISFFARPLGEVLAVEIVRAERVSFGAYRYDVTAIKRHVAAIEDLDHPIDFGVGPFIPAESPRYFGIARDHDSLEPVWYVGDAMDASFVAACSEAHSCSIEEHVSALLPELAPPGSPDDVVLIAYLSRLERALRLRYVLVA